MKSTMTPEEMLRWMEQQRSGHKVERNYAKPKHSPTTSPRMVPKRHQKPVAPSNCSEPPHHWVLQTPAGTYSEARCKKCGATRQMCNVDPANLANPFERAQRFKE